MTSVVAFASRFIDYRKLKPRAAINSSHVVISKDDSRGEKTADGETAGFHIQGVVGFKWVNGLPHLGIDCW